jgi:hypothetical protein
MLWISGQPPVLWVCSSFELLSIRMTIIYLIISLNEWICMCVNSPPPPKLDRVKTPRLSMMCIWLAGICHVYGLIHFTSPAHVFANTERANMERLSEPGMSVYIYLTGVLGIWRVNYVSSASKVWSRYLDMKTYLTRLAHETDGFCLCKDVYPSHEASF